MPNSLDTSPSSQLATLVTFRWHNNVSRLCRWTSDLTIGADTFTALPEMDVTLDKFLGNPNEEENATIVLPKKIEPFLSAINGAPQAYIFVDIEEVDPREPATRRWLTRGEVKVVKSNPEEKSRLIEIMMGGLKDKLKIPLGVLCTTLCSWTFGDRQCRGSGLSGDPVIINLPALKDTATITAISGTAIILSGLSITAVMGYWKFGYVERNGVRLMVRDYTTGTSMVLMKPPPTDWLDQSIVITPGCDKTIETCRGRWNNETHHGGFGRKMPSHHPLFETPDDS